MDLSWEKPLKPVIIKKKKRQMLYNKSLNLYKRKRTFDGINQLKYWKIIKKYINFKKKLNCLEIGSHEGQSAIFFLKNILLHKNSKLLCCDPWFKSHWLNLNPTNLCYEDVFNFNVKINKGGKKIKKFRGKNDSLYKKKWFKSEKYDIIYIDDIHTYESTILNIEKGFPQLKIGGVMIFDDYDAKYAIKEKYDKKGPAFWCDPVKKAVDAFIKKNKKNVKVIFHKYQMMILKTSN